MGHLIYLVMEWIIKIEGKPDQRILVKFEPMEEMLHYIGQYKPKNKDWIKFCESLTSMNTDLGTIQSTLSEVCDELDARLEVYKNLAEGFNIIRNIKVIDEVEE